MDFCDRGELILRGGMREEKRFPIFLESKKKLNLPNLATTFGEMVRAPEAT